jgi:hypothetical protein
MLNRKEATAITTATTISHTVANTIINTKSKKESNAVLFSVTNNQIKLELVFHIIQFCITQSEK